MTQENKDLYETFLDNLTALMKELQEQGRSQISSMEILDWTIRYIEKPPFSEELAECLIEALNISTIRNAGPTHHHMIGLCKYKGDVEAYEQSITETAEGEHGQN
jgi:hypothetical protein